MWWPKNSGYAFELVFIMKKCLLASVSVISQKGKLCNHMYSALLNPSVLRQEAKNGFEYLIVQATKIVHLFRVDK